jgi:hypothetical protein
VPQVRLLADNRLELKEQDPMGTTVCIKGIYDMLKGIEYKAIG